MLRNPVFLKKPASIDASRLIQLAALRKFDEALDVT
jgi:hypothetical protein